MALLTVTQMTTFYGIEKEAVRHRIRYNKIKPIGKVEGKNIFLYNQDDVDTIMRKDSRIQAQRDKVLYPLISKFNNDLARKYIMRGLC